MARTEVSGEIPETDMEELLRQHPGRWPLTEQEGNTLSIGEDGLSILDDRAGGEVNHYDPPLTEADLIGELDCQEDALAELASLAKEAEAADAAAAAAADEAARVEADEAERAERAREAYDRAMAEKEG